MPHVESTAGRHFFFNPVNLTTRWCDVPDENTKEHIRKEQTYLIYYLEFALTVLCSTAVKQLQLLFTAHLCQMFLQPLQENFQHWGMATVHHGLRSWLCSFICFSLFLKFCLYSMYLKTIWNWLESRARQNNETTKGWCRVEMVVRECQETGEGRILYLSSGGNPEILGSNGKRETQGTPYVFWLNAREQSIFSREAKILQSLCFRRNYH